MTETFAQIQRAVHAISTRWRMTSLDALEAMLAVCEHAVDERARFAVDTICESRALSRIQLADHLRAAIQAALEDRADSLAGNLTQYLGEGP